MPWLNIPDVDKCCWCVLDLKTAVTIIAVIGIISSPMVSWAIVRHSYTIRVSWAITTHAKRPDVFDVNLNNVLSFGFAANAGLGPSCLSPQKSDSKIPLVVVVKYLGWVVLVFDLFFLFSSIFFLYNIFRGKNKNAAKYFMIAVAISLAVSFIYALLYVAACLTIGGSFPVFEFLFAFIDVGICIIWVYFLVVIRAYIRLIDLRSERDEGSWTSQYSDYCYRLWNPFGYIFNSLSNRLHWLISYFFGKKNGSNPAS